MHIHKHADVGHILNEDLTSIDTKPSDVAHLFKELVTLCKVSKGVGVAANQLGIKEDFFFVAAGAKLEGRPVGHVCIKPSWRPHPEGQEVEIFGEGCLSLPGELYAVKR